MGNDAVKELQGRVSRLEKQVLALMRHGREWEKGRAVVAYELATDTTFTRDDLYFRHFINCTAAAAITFPPLAIGEAVEIRNTGTETLTVKDSDGTDVGTITMGEAKELQQLDAEPVLKDL